MKKLLALVAFVAMTTIASAFSFSIELTAGQTIYLTITGSSTVKVVPPATVGWTGYTTPTGRLDIPAAVEHEGTTYNVTAIDRFAFQQCTGLTAVSIPGSVVSIGQRAFAEDAQITSVVIAEGVQRIDMMAFFMCSSLDTIVLPTTLSRIAVSAFEETAYYNDAANWIGNVMLTLSGWVLRGSPLIVGDVAVPGGIVGLANNAFFNCQEVDKAILPSTLQYLGEGAFKECYALDTVQVDAVVPPSLYDDTFEGVTLPLTIVVPCSTATAYSTAAYWNGFDIVEASCGGDEPWVPVNPLPQPLPEPLPQLGIEGIDGLPSMVTVAMVDGGVLISNADGLGIELYDLMGRRVAAVQNAANAQFMPLPAAGLYVLRFPTVGGSTKISYWK
jgi:hypothetical protein